MNKPLFINLYKDMIHQRYLMLFIFLNLVSLFLTPVKSQTICINNGNYTTNSSYQTNLNTLLSNMSTNMDHNGFYSASSGQSTNRVYTTALCRGDIQLDLCRSCVQNATNDLVQACPNYMQAILWHEFCTLRYSNASIIGNMDTSTPSYFWNPQNTTRPAEFTSDLITLLDDVHGRASNGGSLRKVAVGNTSTIDLRNIFALVQCTPDLSPVDCNNCLMEAAQRLPVLFYGLIGGRVFFPSCILHYEPTSFYNVTRIQELEIVPSLPPSSLPSSPPPGNNDNRNSNTNRTTTIIIVVVSVVVGIIIVVLVSCFIMKMIRKLRAKSESVDDISIVYSLQYDFSIIKAATSDFSDDNKLGQGGFGAVYRGKLPNGQEIAVKRLSRDSGQGDLEFKNEVMLLVKLQHRNLVRLLGFSLKGSEKLLVYEFVQNASLDAFIFDPTKRSLIDWDKRSKIIGGITRGILYLHEDSRLRIIHRDLKASNVLLDGDMNPKIADFGMARLFVPDETQGCTSRIVGTYGYMAPEYAMRGQFSVKSDVFSFGVLLLEIISGQKNNFFRHGETESGLISSAWEYWRHGTASNLVDPVLRVGSSIPIDILRCIHIGLLRVQENATVRPTIASVILMLNSFSITLPVPSSPAFFVHDGYDLQEFRKSDGAESGNSVSQNEMSISEFIAR